MPNTSETRVINKNKISGCVKNDVIILFWRTEVSTLKLLH